MRQPSLFSLDLEMGHNTLLTISIAISVYVYGIHKLTFQQDTHGVRTISIA